MAIPSLGYGAEWIDTARQLHPGLTETINDLVENRSSVSYQLAATYFQEFATRYASRSSLFLWELGNELNLLVTLPPPSCHPQQFCFNTSAMAAYTTSLASILQAHDPQQRPVSSGFSLPRASAWHQEHCQTSTTGSCAAGYWGLDTPEQWSAMLQAQQVCCSVWSIHHYASSDCYFDKAHCIHNASLVVSGSSAS